MGATNAEQLIRDDHVNRKLVGLRGWLVFPAIGLVCSPLLTLSFILYGLWSLNRKMGLLTDLILAIIAIALGVAILFYFVVIVFHFFEKRRNARKTYICFIAIQLIAPILFLFLLTLGLLLCLKYYGRINISGDMIYAINEIVLHIMILFYIFIAALRFFIKSLYAPQTIIRLTIIVMIIDIVASLIRILSVWGMGSLFLLLALVGRCTISAIWILYFRLSKRVKATFVKQEYSFSFDLPYKIGMPIRYLTQRRISWLAFSAVALCVFIVLLVMTVMAGLVNDFKEKTYLFTGDCVVSTESMVGFAYYEDFIEMLEETDFVEAVSPAVKSYALIGLRGSERRAGVEILGIDPALHGRVTGIGRTLEYHKEDASRAFEPEHDPNLPGVVFGIDLLDPRDVHGNYTHAPSPSRMSYSVSCFPLTPRGAAPGSSADMVNTKTFYFSDKSQSGLARVDGSLVYLPLEWTQILCGMTDPNRVSAIHIKFKKDVKLQAGCDKVAAIWDSFKQEKADQDKAFLLEKVATRSWKDYRRSSIAPMEKEQTLMAVMFGFVGITTVFIVFVVSYMIISHKTKDIGILKSIGASNGDIFQLFAGFAFLIGLLGSSIGLYAGWLFLVKISEIENWLFDHFKWQLWDRTIYAIGDIPNRIEAEVVITIFISAIIACLIGVLVPSWQAARQRPVETLQVNQL